MTVQHNSRREPPGRCSSCDGGRRAGAGYGPGPRRCHSWPVRWRCNGLARTWDACGADPSPFPIKKPSTYRPIPNPMGHAARRCHPWLRSTSPRQAVCCRCGLSTGCRATHHGHVGAELRRACRAPAGAQPPPGRSLRADGRNASGLPRRAATSATRFPRYMAGANVAFDGCLVARR